MANVPSEADRLLEAGRKKILRSCFLFGGPPLAILVVAGLQCAGMVHVAEYFAVDPAKADHRAIWLALAGLALFHFLCMGIGVRQGWGAIRRAKQLRQQSAPGRSTGVSGETRSR